MTVTAKKLAFGQLPSTSGDIAAPSSNKWVVHTILLYNGNTSTETVELKYNDGTNEYTIYKIDVDASDTVLLESIGEGIVLDSSASEKLTGSTTTASKVTYLITGSEVS